MKLTHALARPLAASAAVGFAFLGFTGTAGATTVTVTVPPAVGGIVGTNPIATVGSGTISPLPGTNATVPVHGTDDAKVDSSTVSSIAPVGQAGPEVRPHRPIVTEHSSIDACIAAAVLSDRSPVGCGALAEGSPSLADSISHVGTAPSLADSLARVGACVRIAVLSNRPLDACSAPDTVGGLDDQTVADVLTSNGLCGVGQQLGLSDLATCSTDTGVVDASTGTFDIANNAVSADECLGLAVVTGIDTSQCSPANPGTGDGLHGRGTGRDHSGTTGPHGRANGSTAAPSSTSTPAAASSSASGSGSGSAPNTVLNGNSASSTSAAPSSSPFSGQAAGGIAGLGLGLAAIAKHLRRMRSAQLA